MRILEYNEFNSEKFPKIEDIQACFYDITEDEDICPPSIFQSRHVNVIFVGGGFGKRKILDFKEDLTNYNKKYNAKKIWEIFDKGSIKLDNTTIELELKKCDYQFFYVGIGFKKLPKFNPTFSRFSHVLGDGNKFNQDYGKGEDIYKKVKKMFRDYDDDKNKELFDIIDILEGCIGRTEDTFQNWKPLNYLVSDKDGNVNYQGYFMYNLKPEEELLWKLIFREKIESSSRYLGFDQYPTKIGYKVIDGILD